jgi:MFS family permease
VLFARAGAWLGRGVRTPVRKALLAGAVTPDTYGRAFGFERMLDTCGAIVGPLSAMALLHFIGPKYPTLFALTLIPGLMAALVIAWFVKEKNRVAVKHISFTESLRSLPSGFRQFAVAVGLFGLGDFSHTLLILLAIQSLTPAWGVAHAATIAAGLYVLHNVVYAGSSAVAGWLADHFDKRQVLAASYFLAALMGVAIILLPLNVGTLAAIFAIGGMYVAAEETLEDSLTAELVAQQHHGMAFGTLATVNGIGDFASSLIVGLLWTAFGTATAFGYSAALFVIGGVMVARLAAPSRAAPSRAPT